MLSYVASCVGGMLQRKALNPACYKGIRIMAASGDGNKHQPAADKCDGRRNAQHETMTRP